MLQMIPRVNNSITVMLKVGSFLFQKLLQREKQMSKHAETARKKLLHECKILHKQLQECNTNFPAEGEDEFILGSSLQEASDLLTTSDNRISQLLSEVHFISSSLSPVTFYSLPSALIIQHFVQAQVLQQDNIDVGEADDATDDTRTTDNELRKMLRDILTENASLRKQVNSVIRRALKMDIQCKKDDVPDDKLY